MVNFFDNFYWTFFLIFLFIIISLKVCELFHFNYKKSLFLFIWHFLFGAFYIWFTLTQGGADAIGYYLKSISEVNFEFNFGTNFVILFTRVFSKYLGMSYIDLFIINNFIGFIGLLAFAASLEKAITGKSKKIYILTYIILFLPSLSFWTTSIGKDSISFMGVGLALWSSLDFSKRKSIFIFALLSIFMVRPHIGGAMLVAFTASLIFDSSIKPFSRLLLAFISIISVIILIPVMLNYVGLNETNSVSDVDDYINIRQESNLEGGSSIDISSMSLPVQMFTYLFRPLPFEAHSIFALFASFDNLLLIFLSLIGLFFIVKKNKPSINSNRFFLWLYFYISLIILATTTANLGIAMRQKWMILPFLIFLLLSIIGNNELKIEKKK